MQILYKWTHPPGGGLSTKAKLLDTRGLEEGLARVTAGVLESTSKLEGSLIYNLGGGLLRYGRPQAENPGHAGLCQLTKVKSNRFPGANSRPQ